MAPREYPIREARAQLAEVVNRAADAGEVTHLTRHGKRVAAVVPDELLAAVPRRVSAAWERMVRSRMEAAKAEAEFWETAAAIAAEPVECRPVGTESDLDQQKGRMTRGRSSGRTRGVVVGAHNRVTDTTEHLKPFPSLAELAEELQSRTSFLGHPARGPEDVQSDRQQEAISRLTDIVCDVVAGGFGVPYVRLMREAAARVFSDAPMATDEEPKEQLRAILQEAWAAAEVRARPEHEESISGHDDPPQADGESPSTKRGR